MGKIADLAGPLARSLAGVARMGMILGSGFNAKKTLEEHLPQGWEKNEHSYKEFGIDTPPVEGHCNSMVLSEWDGVPVVISRGRLHLYQLLAAGQTQLLRLWVGTLLTLMAGGTRVIVTNAVGSLTYECPEGSLAIPSKLFSLYMPSAYYLNGNQNEFVAAGSMLPHTLCRFRDTAHDEAIKADLKLNTKQVKYAAVVGPAYEDRGDIEFLQSLGVGTVGMSLTPELGLFAVENKLRKELAQKVADGDRLVGVDHQFTSPIRVGPVNFVTNDETDPRPEGELLVHGSGVMNVAAKHRERLGYFLTQLITSEW